MNSLGDVYWINADQALNAGAGTTVAEQASLASYGRRFTQHQIVKVDLQGARACWVARSEAVLCEKGGIRSWPERTAGLAFTPAGASSGSRTVIAVGIGAAQALPGDGFWRINAVEEWFELGSSLSNFSQGATYLKIDGAAVDAGSLLGKRDLGSATLLFDDQCPQEGKAAPCLDRGITGKQFRTALQSLFDSRNPLVSGVSMPATYSGDGQSHQLDVRLTPLAGNRCQMSASMDGGSNPAFPNLAITVDFEATASSVTRLKVSKVDGGDPGTLSAGVLSNPFLNLPNPNIDPPDVYQFPDSDEIRLDSGLMNWFAVYTNPVQSRDDPSLTPQQRADGVYAHLQGELRPQGIPSDA